MESRAVTAKCHAQMAIRDRITSRATTELEAITSILLSPYRLQVMNKRQVYRGEHTGGSFMTISRGLFIALAAYGESNDLNH